MTIMGSWPSTAQLVKITRRGWAGAHRKSGSLVPRGDDVVMVLH